MTKAETRPVETDAFVERIGEFFDQIGSTRIAGRIVGWLLVCDPPHQSAEELAQATGASKGSVSNMAKLCVAGGLIERIGVPGQRRAYYQIRPEAWSDLFFAQMSQMSELRRIADEGLKALADTPVERMARLQGMRDVYAFYEGEMPSLFERWKASQEE